MGVVAYLSLGGRGREVAWGGRLLTFSAFRMGAYSNKYGIYIIIINIVIA